MEDISKQGRTSGSQPSLYTSVGKRGFDACFATLGLLVLGVPMLCVAAGILLGDGAPILFRQRRVGRHGRLFVVLKFRTMRNRPDAGTTVTVAGDSRVTRIGALLRRYKLDELPQLINVLKGDMSFVGPRPDVPGFADQLEGEVRKVLSIRPGITGPATLAFRDEEQLLAGVADPIGYNRDVIYPEKIRLNLEYIGKCSLKHDLKCILQTLGLMR